MSLQTLQQEQELTRLWSLVTAAGNNLADNATHLEGLIAELENNSLYADTASQEELDLVAAYKAEIIAVIG